MARLSLRKTLRARLDRRERKDVDKALDKAAERLTREAKLLELKQARVAVAEATAHAERTLADIKKRELKEAVEARKAKDEFRAAERELRALRRKPVMRTLKKGIRTSAKTVRGVRRAIKEPTGMLRDLDRWASGNKGKGTGKPRKKAKAKATVKKPGTRTTRAKK